MIMLSGGHPLPRTVLNKVGVRKVKPQINADERKSEAVYFLICVHPRYLRLNSSSS
jgi:hypothetical protein